MIGWEDISLRRSPVRSLTLAALVVALGPSSLSDLADYAVRRVS